MSLARVVRLAAGCVLLAGCGSAPAPSSGAESLVATDEVREIVGVLAADSLEGRRTGTPGSARASRFLAERMRRYGLEPAGDSGYFQRVTYRAAQGPEGETLRLACSRLRRHRRRRRGLQPGRPDSRVRPLAAQRSRGARRPLRPHRYRQAGGGRLDQQRRRRRCVRRGDGARRGARAGEGPAEAHGRRPPHQRRGVRRAGHPVVPGAAPVSARFDGGGPAGGDGRPAGHAGGRGQALAHRLRALHHGGGAERGRASRGGGPASGVPVLRAERQHRVRDARHSGAHAVVLRTCTATTTSRRTRWSGSTSTTLRGPPTW